MKKLDDFKEICLVRDTSKLYYGKYSFRAVFNINGAVMMSYLKFEKYSSFDNFSKLVDSQINTSKKQIKNSIGNPWFTERHRSLSNTNASMLYNIYESCNTFKGQIRTRAEGSTFIIFTETEEILMSILNDCQDLANCVCSIQRPANDSAKTKLEEGVIFSVAPPKYKWKVQLKYKQYTLPVREQIWQYLDNFPEAIILPKGVKGRLDPIKGREWNRGNYYVNDESALLFLKMIAPDFVHKIFKLEQHVDK